MAVLVANSVHFLPSAPIRCPFGGPRSAWLAVDASDDTTLVALLRSAVVTPDYDYFFVLVPVEEAETYAAAGFVTVGLPSKNMCGGRRMYIMQCGRARPRRRGMDASR